MASEEETSLNAPERLEGTMKGPGVVIDAREQRMRRTSLSRLMAAGKSDDRIFDLMDEEFGMSEDQVRKLMKKIFKSWETEDKERQPHVKAAARRRIYDEIDKAAELAQYNAVASLEKTLSSVEGTSEPENTKTPADARQINALIFVLGDMPQERLLGLVQEEKAMRLPSASANLLDAAIKNPATVLND